MSGSVPAQSRGNSKASNRTGRAVVSLTGPTYVWLALSIFLPLAAMLCFSFMTDVPFGNRTAEFTWENYQKFFEKDFYQTLMWRSFNLGALVTALCFLFGYPCAYMLAKTVKGRWREAMLLLIILPFWTNALVRVFSWTLVMQGGGFLDTLVNVIFPGYGSLELLFTYPAIVIGIVHSNIPYMILTCYISIESIENSQLEAARSLGAGRISIVRRIVIPQSMPGIVAGSILIFVPVVGAFMEPRILGGSNGTFIGTVIEDQFTGVFNWPLGAALSFLMLGFVLLALILCYPIIRRGQG